MSTISVGRLGFLLGGWDDKDGQAAKYSWINSDYRTWKPTISSTAESGCYLSTRIDHIRGLAADDHNQLEISFDRDGKAINVRSVMKIQGRMDLDTGLITAVGALAGPEYGIAAGLAAKVFNSLYNGIQQMNEYGGRLSFPAVVQHNINIIAQCVMPPLSLPIGKHVRGDIMHAGELIGYEQPMTSPNGQYTFRYQGDGNLVLYRNRGSKPLWASNTCGSSLGVCILQEDGNLVIYNSEVAPVWSSGTWQHSGSRLVVQDDGNVVIYNPGNAPVWATNTVQPIFPTGPEARGNDMQPGEVLSTSQSICSNNGQFVFVYQDDGNLVLYQNGNALWASNTAGNLSGVCILQEDGNLVIYNIDCHPIWSSGTWQHPGSRLVVQDDGNVVIYNPGNAPVWATNTMQ